MTTLTVEAIVSEAGLRALATDWRGLWRRSVSATPFASPAWALAWWDQFGTGRPVVGVLRAGSRLLGLLPAYVLDEGIGTNPRLLPIGAGLADTMDALLDPAAPPDAATRLLAAVLRGAGPIAKAELIDLPPGSLLRAAAPPPGWHAVLHRGAACPVLALPQGGTLREAIPATTHRKLRMVRHRAARAGGFAVEWADAATLPRALDTLFALHAARWAADGQPGGVLADPRVSACLRAATAGLVGDGAVRLAVLRIAGAPASACLAWAPPGRLLLYMSGYDAAQAYCSPGTLLLGELAEAALRDGMRELHFLRGDEAYKYAWGAVDRHNATLELHRA